jgi:hypothetical protein
MPTLDRLFRDAGFFLDELSATASGAKRGE